MSVNRRVSTPRRDFQTMEIPLKKTLLWALNMKDGNLLMVVTRALFEQEAESFQQAKRFNGVDSLSCHMSQLVMKNVARFSWLICPLA